MLAGCDCQKEVQLTLGLTGLEENVGDDLVDLANKLEQRVIRQVLEREFTLSSVSGVLYVRRGRGSSGGLKLTVFRRTA